MEKFLKKKIPLFFYHFFPPFSPRCYYYTCGGSRARAKRTPILQVFLLGTPNNNNNALAFLLPNEKRRNKRRRRQRRRRRQNKWWAKRRRRRCPQRHHHLRAKKEKEKEVDIIIIIIIIIIVVVANIWSARYRTRKRSRESCLGSNCRRRNAIMRVVEEGRK